VPQEYMYAIIGGILIGLSSAGILWSNGRILGISGILSKCFVSKKKDLYWRIAFIVGLIVGSFFIEPLGFSVMSVAIDRNLMLIAAGGLLVGFGTTVGGGCTSGHGVCGVSRLSVRSIVATLLFMLSAMVTVYLLSPAKG
jgi:uncharacterized membrane protein YedE/YeeE